MPISDGPWSMRKAPFAKSYYINDPSQRILVATVDNEDDARAIAALPGLVKAAQEILYEMFQPHEWGQVKAIEHLAAAMKEVPHDSQGQA